MKIRLKRRPHFSLEKLLLFVAILCVSTFALLEYASISIPLFSLVKWPLLYVGGACLISQLNLLLKNFMKKKYFYLWIVLLVFCVSLILSANANDPPAIGVDPMKSTMRMVVFLIELLALMIWIAEKGYGSYLINFLFRYVLILVIATDLLLFSGLITFYDGSHEAYLVGTKFIVSYLHMELLTLWFMKNSLGAKVQKVSRWVLILMAVFLILVSIRVQCMTGVLGCLVLFICFMRIDKPSRRGLNALNYPVCLLIALLICLVFPFIAELVMSIPVFRYFVVEVLGRNANLTGRIEIFQLFGDRMADHSSFGFGIGNGNAAAKELFGYANAQNAMLQWILQAGAVTTVILVVYLLMVFAQRSKLGNFKRSMPIVILIYVYILLGMVETTFSMNFFLWVAVLFMLTNEKLPEDSVAVEQETQEPSV